MSSTSTTFLRLSPHFPLHVDTTLLLSVKHRPCLDQVKKCFSVQIPGGVTAAKGYRAAGMYAAVRAGKKRDLALVVSDTDAVSAGDAHFSENLLALPLLLLFFVESRNC